jgi:periplasmic protein TonB
MKQWIVRLVATACIATSTAYADTSARGDIESTFDRNKGQIYALYGRALKESPGLKGRVDLEISIATSGEAGCRVVSSQLGAPELERQICEKVKTWRFATRPAPIKVKKPIEFFPAA